MSLWTFNKPPNFHNPSHTGNREPVATESGWVDPVTGEVLVAISNLVTKSGPAIITRVTFGATSYAQGAPLSVTVHFEEKVDVAVGASLVVSWTGLSGNVSLQAAAQSGVYDVVFDKQADNVTPQVVPSEAGTLSLGAQSIVGTVNDSLGAAASNLAISASIAATAGSVVVA